MSETADVERRAPGTAPVSAGPTLARDSVPIRYTYFQDPFAGLGVHLPTIDGLARMADTDETIGAIMWCIETTLAQVDWTFQAEVDGEVTTTDKKALRWAEWAGSLLDDMQETFSEHVEEALSMITLGHAPCEIVTKQRDGISSRFSDGYYGIATLPLIDQRSIRRWNYDQSGNLVSLTQASVQGSAEVEMWKIINYRIRARLNRPMGRSLFNNAFRVWKLKNRIQDAEAVGIERELAGLPVMRVPEEEINTAAETKDGKPTPDAVAAQGRIGMAVNAVSNLRFSERGGLVIPSDTFREDDRDNSDKPKWDFDIITSAGQRTIDTASGRRDYDRAIARIAMMQFLHLGDRSTGSYSLSDDQSSMAVRSLMSIAWKIADGYTRGALNTVWRINGLPMKYRPRLIPSVLSKDGVQQIGTYFNGLGKVLGLLDGDPDARVQALGLGGIITTREKQMTPLEAAPTTDPAAGAPPATAPTED